MAVLLPFLALMFVIAVDFARVFYYSLTIENAARNGALYASDPIAAARSPYTSLQQAALADTSNLTPPPSVSSSQGVDPSGNAYVTVTVSWPFATVTRYPGIPSPLTLSRTVQMRVAPTTPQ
jgi:Flp pilus assembly protein TadG